MPWFANASDEKNLHSDDRGIVRKEKNINSHT